MHAQEQYDLDSLQKKYESLSDSKEKINTVSLLFNSILYSDPEMALKYAREELEISERLIYVKGKADGLYHIGVYHTNTHHQDSAKIYFTRASEFYKMDENIKGLTAVIHGQAIVEYTQGNYTEALELLEENIRIYTANINDTSDLNPVMGLAVSYDLMGQIHMYKGKYNLALELILKSLKYYDDLDEPLRRADALNHIGSVEFYLNNYEKSISYNTEAYSIYGKSGQIDHPSPE
jgi:tetratricopeptide (TPR) repeat protein